MADIVYMAKAKWTALLDAIRSKSGKTDALTADTAKTAVEGITGGGDYDLSADYCNNTGTTLKVQEGATQLPSYALNINYTVKSLILPNTINRISVHAIYDAYALQTITLPQSVTYIDSEAIYVNAGAQITNITLLSKNCMFNKESFYIRYYSNFSGGIVLLDFSHAEQIYQAPNSLPIYIGHKYDILVPYSLYAEWKSATNWAQYAEYIKATEHDLAAIAINGDEKINIYSKKSLQLSILYNENNNCPSEQQGVTYSIVSGPATVAQNGTVTVTDAAAAGDEIVVKATSTYNSSISTQYTINVVNIASSISIENTTQWIDSSTAENGYKVYQSDAGSYNVDNGKSTVTLTFAGYTTVVIYVKQSSEYNFDYVEVGPVDGTATRAGSSNLFSAKGSNNKYQKVTITLPDTGTHTVQVIYSKDSSGYNGDDRGYFYIAEGECS